MIEIKIADATKLTPQQLLATAEYLMKLGGHELVNVEDKPVTVIEREVVPGFTLPAPPPPPVPESPFAQHYASMLAEAAAVETETTSIDGVEINEGDNVYTPYSGELDSEGLPWDGRIHSAGKTQYKATGAWKLKREVEPAYVKQVQDELRLKVVRSVKSVFPNASKINITHSGDVEVEEDFLVEEPKTEDEVQWDEPAPAVPAPPAPPAKAPAPPAVTFASLMKRITEAGATGKIKMPAVVELVQSHGVENLPALGTRLDLIPAIYADLEKMIGG